ncbi:MAG: hypothetical protein ABIJ08_05755 [Nanoarchaeota archaeon]
MSKVKRLPDQFNRITAEQARYFEAIVRGESYENVGEVDSAHPRILECLSIIEGQNVSQEFSGNRLISASSQYYSRLPLETTMVVHREIDGPKLLFYLISESDILAETELVYGKNRGLTCINDRLGGKRTPIYHNITPDFDLFKKSMGMNLDPANYDSIISLYVALSQCAVEKQKGVQEAVSEIERSLIHILPNMYVHLDRILKEGVPDFGNERISFIGGESDWHDGIRTFRLYAEDCLKKSIMLTSDSYRQDT